MNEKQATDLITKGKALVVKSAARIKELETANQALATKTAAAEKTAKDVAALGDRIVDAMIKQGQAKEADRAKILANLANPVKVAGHLINVLEKSLPVSTGSVDTTSPVTGEKSARRTIEDVDAEFRRQTGLA